MSLPYWRIDVWTREDLKDSAGETALAQLREMESQGIDSVRASRGYLLSSELDAKQVERAASELLADPVVDHYQILAPGKATPATKNGTHRLEILRKPGVMDPPANSVKRVLQEMKIPVERVMTFRAFEVRTNLTAPRLQQIAEKTLYNDTVEDLFLDSPTLPFAGAVAEYRFVRREIPLLECNDAALEKLSREMTLSLSLIEMKTVKDYFQKQNRNPTDAELETIAQTWSEHCKHKTLAGPVEFQGKKYQNLLKETVFAATKTINAPWCISVFQDNAGIIEFDEKWAVCFKVETHNHPSAIEPYGGAGTGIGGVIRDVLGCGLGAKPIASTDVFCVGPMDLPDSQLPTGALHPKRVLKGVVSGVRDYGNRMGIPTVNGAVYFHPDYVGNPLVYCGNVGLLPRDKCFKAAKEGDVILVVGGRTGRDGIHGATFSSVELHEESETVSSTAVQIGDPITEKKVMEGVLRARDRELFTAITDCGAGGLSSAVGEMAAELGAEVDLEKVPLKYPGLSYSEIWISEAQERMVLSVPPEKLAEALATFAAEEVEATAIGKFTNTHRLILRYRGQIVGDLEMEFLHEGTPKVSRKASFTPPQKTADKKTPSLKALLSSPNIASKEWIIRLYDHEVQGGSAIKPLTGIHEDGPSDAAVVAPIYGNKRGIAIGCGMNPEYGRLDPYKMAASAIEEALRNVVAVGGDPKRTAILDNFSWGNCDKPENLGSLVLAAQACHDVAIAYGTPFISGKDSLNNEYRVGEKTIVIPPSLLISAISSVEDVTRCVSSDFKQSGSLLLLVGQTKEEIVPDLDLKQGPKILQAVSNVIRSGFALACHDLSEGGLAVAAAEMAFSGGIGARIDLRQVPCDSSVKKENSLLYGESNSRFLLEVDAKHRSAVEKALQDLPFAWVGETVKETKLSFLGLDGKECLSDSLDSLRSAWKGAFPWAK